MVFDGREIRLRRLMGEGRAVVIAMDHGLLMVRFPVWKTCRKRPKR